MTDLVITVLRTTVLCAFDALQLCFLFRAILSWFDPEGEGKLSAFFYAVTEPLILPIRLLCERMGWFEETPIDIPFIMTYILLAVLQVVLEIL